MKHDVSAPVTPVVRAQSVDSTLSALTPQKVKRGYIVASSLPMSASSDEKPARVFDRDANSAALARVERAR